MTTTAVSTMPKYNYTKIHNFYRFQFKSSKCYQSVILLVLFIDAVKDDAYIVALNIFVGRRLNGISEVAEKSTAPEQQWETTKHLLAEFDPLRSRFWRSKCIRSITSEHFLSFLWRQTLQQENCLDVKNFRISIIIFHQNCLIKLILSHQTKF